MRYLVSLYIALFCIHINGQALLPNAGNVLQQNISKIEQMQLQKNGVPVLDKPLTVIDFDSLNTSFKGNYPFSWSYALSISPDGDIVFVGSGGGIYITDVSDPGNPVILSEIRTRSLVDDCTYDPVNKRLYVCAYFSGIEIWDLSDLSNPVRMSRIATEPYPRSGVAFSGDYLFIASNTKVWSIDISDPYQPQFVNSVYLDESLILQILLKDSTLYVVSDVGGLKLIDVSDPLNLNILARYGFISGSEFDIKGDYLYAVTGSAELMILNIADENNVSVAGTYYLGGYPMDIQVIDNKAYVGKVSTDGGLQIIDISDPSSPVPLSIYSGNFQFVTGIDSNIYTTSSSTFSIFETADSSTVQYLGGFEIPGFVQDISVKGNHVFTGNGGLRVFDVSDSTHPYQVGYVNLPGDIVKPVNDSLVILLPLSMTASNTVNIVDITDPVNPVSLSSYTSPFMTQDAAIKDNNVFIACWWDGIRILNFNDPGNLHLIKRFMNWFNGAVPGVDFCYARAVDIEGDYLYIVDYGPFSGEDTRGLYICDISDPQNPTLIKRYTDFVSYPQDIDVVDGKAYIADGNSGGIEVIDVNDPLNPFIIGYVDLIDGATGLVVKGKYAYVSNYILGGIEIVDISKSTNLTLAGWYRPSGCFALGVDAQDGFVYVADGLAGFQIYKNLLETPATDVSKDFVTTNFRLNQNYPNPFNPITKIEFSVPSLNRVSIKVYDILGKQIAVLLNEEKPAGNYEIDFNGSNLSSGVYFYKMQAGNFTESKKMILIK